MRLRRLRSRIEFVMIKTPDGACVRDSSHEADGWNEFKSGICTAAVSK